MNHPTKKQMQTVIDNFKKIMQFADLPGRFNIYESSVIPDKPLCNTVACVAGWYAHATKSYDLSHLDIEISFMNGADKIAHDLGFDNVDSLEIWADDNPDIWGNRDGYEMFSEEFAYNGMEKRTDKMTCVIEHLEGVRDRLPE